MNKFQHLSQAERYQLQALLGQSIAIAAIALQLRRHVDTIKREIVRAGLVDGCYSADRAHASSLSRKASSRNAKKISHEVWRQVDEHLSLELSPQQVSCRLAVQLGVKVSHESIYLHIYEQARQHGRNLAQLRCSRKRRKKRAHPAAAQRNQRGAIQNRVAIELRPSVVADKSRVGDWEGDTVVGRMQVGGIVTMVERKTRYTLAKALHRRCAGPTSKAICEMLGPHAHRCHTITLDNGSEFALHQEFAAALGADVYFAKPHSPWQRGLNENTNGLLRQYFPKGSCMRDLSPEAVQHAVDRLNHRPRKCLGWRTPHEALFDLPMSKLTL